MKKPNCKCICHGGEYKNDCIILKKGICESCGQKSAEPKNKTTTSSTPMPEPMSNISSTSDVILSDAQKQEVWAGRVKEFNESLIELQKKHKLEVRAQITPDGPIISLIPKE